MKRCSDSLANRIIMYPHYRKPFYVVVVVVYLTTLFQQLRLYSVDF
jgi:hypothetical protein